MCISITLKLALSSRLNRSKFGPLSRSLLVIFFGILFLRVTDHSPFKFIGYQWDMNKIIATKNHSREAEVLNVQPMRDMNWSWWKKGNVHQDWEFMIDFLRNIVESEFGKTILKLISTRPRISEAKNRHFREFEPSRSSENWIEIPVDPPLASSRGHV